MRFDCPRYSATISLCLSFLWILLGAPSVYANDNSVVIYLSTAEDMKHYMTTRLNEKFPQYEIIIEYMPTGNHAAKLKAEGLDTACDISFDLEYSYLSMLEELFAPLPQYDFSVFDTTAVPISQNYMPSLRSSSSIIINIDVLEAHNLPVPTSYQDLLKQEYKGLISMPNPKTSGTGFNVLKSLVATWGEEKAFNYFDKLATNILQFSSSGSGPVNSLIQGEIAIGFGMTAQAVTEINKGAPLKIIEFIEGTPYSFFGYGIIKGKEDKQAVKDVMDFLYSELVYETCTRFFPESIFKNKSFEIENYPIHKQYSHMGHSDYQENQRLLENWVY